MTRHSHARPRDPSGARSRMRPWLAVALAAVVTAAVVAACTVADSGIVPSPVVTAPEADATPTPTPVQTVPSLPREPEVVRWGGNGQQLAVVIRNQSELAVRQAGTLIEAIGADGAVVATATGNPDTTCCTVIGLQPGGEYGLFADLDVPLSAVESVRVTYVDAEPEVPAGLPEPVVNRLLAIEHPAGDTVVRVDIDVFEASSPYVVGQAFLVGPDGRLVGVVSGRFYCVGPGTERELHMQLLRETPPGTRVDRVLVHPIPDGVPPGVAHACQ